jgi:adenosylhomocysteine nucleosidase
MAARLGEAGAAPCEGEEAMNRSRIFDVTLLAGLTLAGCTTRQQTTATARAERRPVIVQGAMDVEVQQLASRLDGARVENVGSWTFWRGTLEGYPVIVSKTMKGVSNAAAATTIAAEHYHPAAIINQGTAGGHEPQLHLYDIVIGTSAINIGAFKTADRSHGQGSNFLEWTPMDLMASESSAGQDPRARTMRRFPGDPRLLAAAVSVKSLYRRGQVVEGVIGSSEVWNSELDRIEWFHREYGTSVEEMETASAAQIAGLFDIPFLGIRVVSDNATNGGAYDRMTGEACQAYVYDVVKAYVAYVGTLQKR